MLFGDKLTTREKVDNVAAVVPPTAGSYYKATAHKDLLLMIEEEAKGIGLSLRDERYALAANGANLAGAMLWQVGQHTVNVKPYLGFTTSNNRRGRLRFYMGGVGRHVGAGLEPVRYQFMYRELMATSKAKTHTRNTDIKEFIKEAVARYWDALPKLERFVEYSKTIELPSIQYYKLMVDTAAKAAIAWSRLATIHNTYKLEGMSQTIYSFMVAYGGAVTMMTPQAQIPCMLKMRNILTDYGLVPPVKKAS